MNREKLESLQVLRALAFIGIFLYHSYVGEFGRWGVSVFFTMSGFLMIYNYYDRNISCTLKDSIVFSLKKIKKLYPLHIITLIIALVYVLISISGNCDMREILFYGIKFLLNVTLMQSFVPVLSVIYSFSGVAWFLSVCMVLYAVFPAILILIKKIRNNFQAFLIIITVYILQIITAALSGKIDIPISYITDFSHWFTYVFPVFRAGDFLAGCALGYIFINRTSEPGRFTATFLEVISMLLAVAAYYLALNSSTIFKTECFKYSVVYLPSSLMLIYAFALKKGYLTRILECKPLVYLGNISAYAFLIHPVVIDGTYLIIGDRSVNKLFIIVLSFVLTVLLCRLYSRVSHAAREKIRLSSK